MNVQDDYVSQTPFTSLFIPRSLKPSVIEEILNRPEVKLEDLMDEENFVYELRNSNPRLLDYFTQNTSKIKQLVDYIVVMPPNPNDNKRAYQYPLLANDIFESDIPVIMSAFLTNNSKDQDSNPLKKSILNEYEIVLPDGTVRKIDLSPTLQQVSNGQEASNKGSKVTGDELLETLFSFVKSEGELNPVLAGYVNKVIQKLYIRNPKKIVEYVYSNEKILMGVVNHIENHSMSEILSILLCYEAYLFDEKKPEYFDLKMRVVEKMLNLFSETVKTEKMSYIGDIVIEAFNRIEVMADGKEFMDRVLTKDNMNKMFNILHRSPPSQAILNICHMILILLNYHHDRRSKLVPSSPVDFLPKAVDNDPMMNAIADNIFVLGKLLTNEKDTISIASTVGQTIKPLGLAKLKVIEVLERIIKIGNATIFAKMSEIGLVNILIDLFVRYQWNNLLQNNLEKVVFNILEKRDTILFEDLIERAQFVQIIIRHFKDDQVQLPRNGKRVKKGNMAHITKFTNELIKIATTDKKVEGYLNRFSEWSTVVVPALKVVNELNNKQIGGYHPRDLQITMFGQTLSSMEQGGESPKAGGFLDSPMHQPNISSFSALNLYVNDQAQPNQPQAQPQSQPQPQYSMQNSLQQPIVVKQDNFVDNSPSLRLLSGGDLSFSNMSPPREVSSFGEKVESLKPMVEKPVSSQPPKVENKFGVNTLTTTNSYSAAPDGKVQVPSPLINNEEPKKIDLNVHKPYINLANSIQNSLARWDLEHSSPSSVKKSYDLEDGLGIQHMVAKKSESEELATASPSSSRNLRNSMIDLRTSKMKLKVKNSDRTDGKKILEMIESFKGPNLNRSVEIAYSESSFSESENLSGDLDFEQDFSLGFKTN